MPGFGRSPIPAPGDRKGYDRLKGSTRSKLRPLDEVKKQSVAGEPSTAYGEAGTGGGVPRNVGANTVFPGPYRLWSRLPDPTSGR